MNILKEKIKKDAFTFREIEVLRLIADGLTNQEISQKLHVSAETVKWYAKQIYSKLGVKNRIQAALKADEIGLLEFSKGYSRREEGKQRLGKLPAQLTSFIGRKKEVAQIQDLIMKNRLMTLTGPGGVGKTRLALQVANTLFDYFREGIWLVELAKISEPERVVSTIANSLKISERNEVTLVDTLKNYLSSKKLLLVIDNFEHLLGAVPLIGEILASAPNVSILATSRERLHVNGEVEYPVVPLELPDKQNSKSSQNYDAIALFIERTQSVKLGHEIQEDQIESVVEICRLLDGLPLAIELAVPLVKLFTPAKIAEQLKQGLGILPTGPRNLPDRQQTLRATLDWSINLLSRDEKILFTNLAVFRGGATLEAIDSICGKQIRTSIFKILFSLVDRNLLLPKEKWDGEMYFAMLETTRQLNQERLNEDKNVDIIHRSHAEYYVDLVERAMDEYSTPRHVYWYRRLQVEQENIRSAYDWTIENDEYELGLRLASATIRYWRNFGFQKEGLVWVETALDLAKQAPALLRGGALKSAGDYCIDLDQVEKGKGYLSEALEIFRQLDNQKNIAWCMALIGLLSSGSQSEITKGLDLIQESFNVFQQLNDLSGMTHACNLLGELARMGEDYEMAEYYYNKCLELAKETGERVTEGIQYANLGMLAYQKGLYELAETLNKQGISIFLEIGAYYGIYYDVGGLAGAALGLGNPKRSARLLGISNMGLGALESLHQQADRAVIQYILDGTKRALDENAFMKAWSEGQNMTVQEAFAYALALPY